MAGTSPGSPRASSPALVGVSPSTSFAGIESGDHRTLIEMVRQGQLDEDPVDLVVLVQLIDQIEQVLLGDGAIRLVVEVADSGLLGGLVLAPHVDRGGRVVPDEHGGEARRSPNLAHQLLNLAADALPHGGGDRLAVDHRRRH